MLSNISIILVKPQMGENIGATARAMKNFGLSDLRLVLPRDGWPNQKAHDMAAHADDIIENAKVFDSVEAAVADLNFVAATASKSRDMVKDVITPEELAEIVYKFTSLPVYENTALTGQLVNSSTCKLGIMFGRESSGLDNEDISYANVQVSIPVSENYDSMNLAMAVAVVCYELFKKVNKFTSLPVYEPKNLSTCQLVTSSTDLASRQDIAALVNFLETELSDKNFFSTPEKKPGMMINIRNIFTRHFYTEQEVRTLRGIFTVLKKK